jgi:hypothetical protein
MAALTAVVTLSSASCTTGQAVQVKVAVTNPNAYPVTVTEIKPTMIFTGDSPAEDGASFSAQNVPLSQGFDPVVPASSSSNFFFSLSPHAPSKHQDDSGSGTYDVSCKISSNLQDQISPTASPLTVHPVLPVF